MNRRKLSYAPLLMLGTILGTGIVTAPTGLFAQPSQRAVALLSVEQLDQLLAPIALYPDQLLGDILMASTYPLEIVEAARWSQALAQTNPDPSAREQALTQADWEPSVKAVAAFPEVLDMMDRDLVWTRKLGDAFLVQQADIMDSVQRLRRQASTAGNLASSTEVVVRAQDEYIYIEPARPEIVYVPYYDPWTVYGPWRWQAYPPSVLVIPVSITITPRRIHYGAPIGINRPYWGWHNWDWRRHEIHIDRDRYEHLGGRPRPPINGPRIEGPRNEGPRNEGSRPDANRPGNRPTEPAIWTHDPNHRQGVGQPQPARVAPIQQTLPVQAQPGQLPNQVKPVGPPMIQTPGNTAQPSPAFNNQGANRLPQGMENERDIGRQAPRVIVDHPQQPLHPVEAPRVQMPPSVPAPPQVREPEAMPQPHLTQPQMPQPQIQRPQVPQQMPQAVPQPMPQPREMPAQPHMPEPMRTPVPMPNAGPIPSALPGPARTNEGGRRNEGVRGQPGQPGELPKP
jgi:hypothetical protein